MSVYSGKISIAQLLLSQGAKAGAKDVEGKMAIHVAASEGNSEFIKILLKASKYEVVICKVNRIMVFECVSKANTLNLLM